MKKSKGWMKICTIAMSIMMIFCGGIGTGLWITCGGGLSQNELTDKENQTENVGNSGENSTNEAGEVGTTESDGNYWYEYIEEFDIDSTSTNEISTEEQLAFLAYMVNIGNTYSGYVFQLTADLDMSAHYWVPIGGHEYDCSARNTSYYFAGEFDGAGHTISGLDTSYADETASASYTYMGLFGSVHGTSNSSHCLIHDVGIVESTIVGYTDVGAVVGYAYNFVELYNCFNTGSVKGNAGRGYVGGIVGYSIGYSTVYRNEIHDCFNTGSVTDSSACVGGVVGFDTYTRVYTCYNTGAVEGGYRVGGIVGYCSTYAFVRACFNVGDVTATSSSSTYFLYVGGVVGQLGSEGSVSYCYYGDCTITGYTTTYQKGIGYDVSTGAEGEDEERVTEYLAGISYLAKTKSWFLDDGNWTNSASYRWDFLWTWSIDADQNDGYPILESSVIYDEDGDFWYFEDGYMPQSVVSSAGEVEFIESYIASLGSGYEFAYSSFMTINITSTTWAEVWVLDIPNNSYRDESYAIVNVCSESSAYYDASNFFVMEPIKWIVAYGEDEPTSAKTAVTAQVVTCGQVASSAGTDWSARRSAIVQNLPGMLSAMEITDGELYYWEYDSFSSSTSQAIVEDDAVSANSRLTVANISEIDALGGSYKATCTDFVAFLLSDGSITSGYAVDYWTRDLAYSLDSSSYYGTSSYSGSYNNGVYVTSAGTISNAWLSNCFGARLSLSLR